MDIKFSFFSFYHRFIFNYTTDLFIATRVMITAKPELKYKMSGLCGNYNGRSADDLTTPSGDIEQDPTVFASTWKTEPSCKDFGDIQTTVQTPCEVLSYTIS